MTSALSTVVDPKPEEQLSVDPMIQNPKLIPDTEMIKSDVIKYKSKLAGMKKRLRKKAHQKKINPRKRLAQADPADDYDEGKDEYGGKGKRFSALTTQEQAERVELLW